MKNLDYPLQLLYKASLNTGEILLDLKLAIITPIYKGSSRNRPKTYHFVYVHPILCMYIPFCVCTSHFVYVHPILCMYIPFDKSTVLNNLIHRISINSSKHIRKMNHKQRGYQSIRNLIFSATRASQDIGRIIKLNLVDLIYLDFASAFDNVDHGILLNKLNNYTIIISMARTAWRYTICYQTGNNLLSSMEQHQVKVTFEVEYPKDQC